MPLPKSDYGDFSASDPLSEMWRAAQDYYMPGQFPANSRGRNVTTAGNYQPRPKTPPVRIDLAAALANRQTPDMPMRAPGMGGGGIPPGWTRDTVYASPVTGGQAAPAVASGIMGNGMPSDIPMPGAGGRVPMPMAGARSNVPMPAANPAFHDMSADAGIADPNRMRLAQALAAGGGQPANVPFNQFNPADLMNQPWRA